MKSQIVAILIMGVLFSGCRKDSTTAGSPTVKAINKDTNMVCKLTSAEMQERRETVLATLKTQMVDRKELDNGYAFKFAGSDEMVDMLTEFIKSERECCGFFVFNLSVSGDKGEAWLELTGENGAKDFIISELGL